MPSTETGQPQTTAHYSCADGERRLVAQRVDGTVQLRDEPARGPGPKHLVEPELSSLAELEAIAYDYVRLAERIDAVPMAQCWF